MYNKGVCNMNLKIIKLFLPLLLLSVVLIAGSTFAEEKGGNSDNKSNTLYKPMADPIRAWMNINFISTIIKNDGISDINVGQDASGLIYPIGSGRTAVYTSGFLWAANVNDPNEEDPHVGGTVYRTGLQAGWIDASGNVITDDPRVRIFRVRPDVYPGGPSEDLGVEAQDEVKSEADVRAQYELDWTEWPGDLGAPYFDGDGDGIYNPDPSSGDIPGVPGANQTIWYVANDQEAARTTFMYGSQPMGIEMQATFWAYRQTGALGNMYFRRYLIINKTDVLSIGPRTFEDMYVSMWSDPDVGDASDDFAGADTVLSLTYSYNGQGVDQIYGETPPAVGFDFFQGPLVEGVAGEDRNKNGVDDADDFAIFRNERVGPGLINLPMTAAYYYINEDPTLTDPVQGSQVEGAVRWYRFMQGRIGLTNQPFTDPNTGDPSPFTLTGDPTAREGWIDGQQFAPGDRRIGAASGPFVMAPGDTQEVVVAEVLGGATEGVDRLSAVALMKFYDQVAQVAYDNFFDLPTPPPPPSVNAGRLDENTNIWYALDEEIILDWSRDTEKVIATESSSTKGFDFQGYNVYQLPSASASVSEGVRVATFDVIDGIGKINDFVFDPTTGSVVIFPVQFGNDVGVKRWISIKDDAIKQSPLINGIRYYFGVTAYNFNPDPLAVPNSLENPVRILTIVPQSSNPGVTYGEDSGSELEVTQVSGTANGGPTVTIVDPTATTGHTYEVTYKQQLQMRNEQGIWVPAATMRYGPDDVSGSSIGIAAVWPPEPGTLDLAFVFNMDTTTGNGVEGIQLDFDPAIRIVHFPEEIDVTIRSITPVVTGNHVDMGVVDDSRTGFGQWRGGEEWIVVIEAVELPVSVDWVIHDDGFDGNPVNATGTTTITEVGSVTRIANQWDVTDTETGQLAFKDQSLNNGIIEFPPTDFFNANVGDDAAPIADGVQISMSVDYVAPINYFSVELIEDPTGTTVLTEESETTTLDIQNYTIFSATISSKAYDNIDPVEGGYSVGTLELEELQQDYEYRFTGVYDEGTVIHGATVYQVIEGGQMASIFRMYTPDPPGEADLANHPLNPNYGTAEPFLIRIPFEVWNVDDPDNHYQVNLAFIDRERNGTEDPFWAWNPSQRMYAMIVNSPYDSNQVIQVDDGPDEFNAAATWMTVHYGMNYGLGAVVRITYANPIQMGIDKFTFTTTAPTSDNTLAKSQVNEINVFPNPYYGVNTEEINKYNRFVTFNHLPARVTARIFNLAGVLVKTIEKNDDGQFLRWDLANQDGLPVASGLYIAYLELKAADGTGNRSRTTNS
jgi:hypothetical protein